MRNVTLKEIFDDDEITDIELIIREKDWKTLREYLNKRKVKLESKGIVADYLYYYMLNELK